MKNKKEILAVLILLASLVSVHAAPQLPHLIYGEATTSGDPLPAGHTIVAVVDGEEMGSIVSEGNGVFGGPDLDQQKLLVQGDIDDSADVEFFISGVKAEETTSFESGKIEELGLSFGALPTPAPPVVVDTPSGGGGGGGGGGCASDYRLVDGRCIRPGGSNNDDSGGDDGGSDSNSNGGSDDGSDDEESDSSDTGRQNVPDELEQVLPNEGEPVDPPSIIGAVLGGGAITGGIIALIVLLLLALGLWFYGKRK